MRTGTTFPSEDEWWAEEDRRARRIERIRAAGLSCLPARKAKKRPAIGGWKTWQSRLPTAVETRVWFSNPHDAVCIVAGGVSGNLECIDFDNHGELFAVLWFFVRHWGKGHYDAWQSAAESFRRRGGG